MKILVTGGAGFIGSHLVDALVTRDHEVVVYDAFVEQVHGRKKPDYLNQEATYVKEDVRNREALKKVIRTSDLIFHEASAVGVGQSMYQVSEYVEANTQGTAVLLDILVREKTKVKKVVIASSMSIYGEGRYLCSACGKIAPSPRSEKQLQKGEWEMHCPACNAKVRAIPTDESKPLESTSLYAMTKRHQEEMTLLLGKTYRLPVVALRYFNVYGPRQALSNPYTGVCAIFSSRVKNGKPPLVYEDGLQSRDFVHVEDIVRANLLVMEKKEADYQVFNVGSGKAVSILEIANALIRLYGKALSPQVVGKYRSGDIRHCFADISRISSLGYRPKWSLQEGLQDLVRWGATQKAVDRSEIADRELLKRGLRQP
ncbi:MAG: NAD-dependent epimerase/dehydratase family protein [Candidatus Omnitrophica bacterium]|nr:NAD-dependent epimerase/dehydratase family protein [Candidatus Omnitrophota bacterium]